MVDDRDPRSPLLPRLILGLVVVGLIAGIGFFVLDVGFIGQDIDLPRLVALIAILLFVGAGILVRPIGAWQVVRSMGIWAAVILVIAGLYASRDELAGFAGRLVGSLAPGVPITGQLTGDGNPESVAFTRAFDGHFAVRATVDDVPVAMLFDTGASFVTLTSNDARRVGIDPAELSFVVPIRTANGVMRAAAITLDTMSIGPIEQRNVRALVAPSGLLGQSLLGLSFLNELHGYAIMGDRLVLTP
ncbi:retropepsin-like aspartic protease family protein [Bauldia sp.]|uniref:retropepsin-like aspartic protease family protein n=1 Tax=Bauldia sp. TaxID=2575872 RepID=UPI003BAC5731